MGATTTTTEGKLDKMKLNNQIVLMRKDVRRARLWLINNLSNRSRKLLAKKGSEQQLTKNKRKAERLKVEIETLKHIDIDDVSKFALSIKQNLEEAQKMLEQLPVEQRSMMRLALHKLVQAQVAKFRQIFPVPHDKIILLIRALGAKYQKKKGKEPVAELKVNRKTPADRPGKTVSTDTKPLKDKNTFSQSDESKNSSSAGEDDNKNSSSAGEDDNKNSSSAGEDDNKNSSSSGEESGNTSPCRLEKLIEEVQPALVAERAEVGFKKAEGQKKSSGKVKVEWPALSKQTFEKREGTMEIKRINLNEPDFIIPLKADPVNNDKLDTNSLNKPLDSFFLGGQLSEEEEENTIGTAGRWNRKQLGVNRRHQNFTDDEPNSKRKMAKIQGNRETKPSKKFPRPLENTESKGSQLDETNLHPSWQAKRKQKEHGNPVTAFQGKKIKFGDD